MKNLTAFLYVQEEDLFGYVCLGTAPSVLGGGEEQYDMVVKFHSVSVAFGLG